MGQCYTDAVLLRMSSVFSKLGQQMPIPQNDCPKAIRYHKNRYVMTQLFSKCFHSASFSISYHKESPLFISFYHNLSGSTFSARSRHWNIPSTTARRASVLFASCFQACRNHIHGFNGNILPKYKCRIR